MFKGDGSMQRVLNLLQAHNYWLITSLYPLYFPTHHVSNLPSSEERTATTFDTMQPIYYIKIFYQFPCNEYFLFRYYLSKCPLSQNLSLFYSLPAFYLHDMDIPPPDEVVITRNKEVNLSFMLPTSLWFPMVPSYNGRVISGGDG
jgi:hypothetical protein